AMCDDDINPWSPEAFELSRRKLGVGAAATAAVVFTASVARAQAKTVGKDVVVKAGDGDADAFLVYPEGKGTWPAVLIWTDIGGLRPVFKDMATRLAAQGYVVLVPNPFYRSAKPAEYANVSFGDPAGRTKLMGYAGALTPGADSDAKAYLA